MLALVLAIVAQLSGAPTIKGNLATLPLEHPSSPGRNGTYYISQTRPDAGRCRLVLLHGFKGSGWYMAQDFRAVAEDVGIALVAPDSGGAKWQTAGAKAAPDEQHISAALAWLDWHAGRRSREARVAIVGHSYGTRMAAHVGTSWAPYHRVVLAHGRYEPETLGQRRLPALFTGSPKDNQFSFRIAQDQYSRWPNGAGDLRTFDCASCRHAMQAAEIAEIARWACQW